MLRHALAGLVVVALAAAGITQEKKDEKKDEKKAMNLLPLAKGTKWEYTATVAGNTTDAVLEVTDVTPAEKGTPALAVITTTVGGKEAGRDSYSADDKGVHQHTQDGVKLPTPTTAVHYPVKAGKTWANKIDVNGQEATLELEQLEPEEVKVPLGKYTTHPVKMAIKVDGKTVVGSTSWYADGVGIVKNETLMQGVTVTTELTKFTPAK